MRAVDGGEVLDERTAVRRADVIPSPRRDTHVPILPMAHRLDAHPCRAGATAERPTMPRFARPNLRQRDPRGWDDPLVSSDPPRHGGVPIAAGGLLALFAAGIVLATSFAVDYPSPVLTAAWLVALFGLLIVIVSAWRGSRATGARWSSALGRTLKAAGQFIFDFF